MDLLFSHSRTLHVNVYLHIIQSKTGWNGKKIDNFSKNVCRFQCHGEYDRRASDLREN